MAHILKFPTSTNKGIVLFTHKEIGYFSKGVKQIRFEWFNNLTSKIFPKNQHKSFFQKGLEEISKDYFIGEHFGWYHRNYHTVPLVDFYLCTPSTVTFQNPDEITTIPLSSSSFINEVFENKKFKKIYDVMCVSHSGNNKRLKDFLKSVRELYDRGKKYRVLLINKQSVLENAKGHYIDLEKDYHSMFTAEEKQWFTLLRIKGSLSLLGLPSQAICEFYNLSKVFALFSEQEGEPRAVSEALICGMPVVINKNIKAGGVGLDMLNDNNSVRFESYENATDALITAVENYAQFKVNGDETKKALREDYTVEIFKDHLKSLYAKHGQQFDGVLDNDRNLANAVNAHITEVPWAISRSLTADINTKKQFEILKMELSARVEKTNLSYAV